MKQYVLAVRIPKELRERMKIVKINWSDFIRSAIDKRIKLEERRKALEMVERLLRDVPPAPPGFTMKSVREDRQLG
jgi:hypothetical protein